MKMMFKRILISTTTTAILFVLIVSVFVNFNSYAADKKHAATQKPIPVGQYQPFSQWHMIQLAATSAVAPKKFNQATVVYKYPAAKFSAAAIAKLVDKQGVVFAGKMQLSAGNYFMAVDLGKVKQSAMQNGLLLSHDNQLMGINNAGKMINWDVSAVPAQFNKGNKHVPKK